MSKWNEMSTNSLVIEIAEMKEKHEAIKREMMNLYEEMENIEKDFLDANNVIQERLNK